MKKRVEILHHCWGAAKQGELVGIMGASGAGKSTLLNSLSGRLRKAGGMEFQGTLRDGSHPVKPVDLRQTAAYVRQDDVLLPTLTVRETILFSANLKLPRTMSKAEKEKAVDHVIDELGLQKCAHTRIGNTEKRGISGGERKRTSIAVELITDPSLIFLDEPTSGLDSYTAESVMRLLVRLAKAGRTVVCTIHQPSAEIFMMMGKLLLLSRGHTVYFGSPMHALSHFKQQGYSFAEFSNPADHIMRVTNVTLNEKGEYKREKDRAKIEGMVEAASKLKPADLITNEGATPTRGAIAHKYKENVPAWMEWPVLMGRSFKNYIRNPTASKARLFQTVFQALLVGLIFLQTGNDSKGVQDRMGALFFILTGSVLGAVQSASLTFPIEKELFLHEQDNYMYRPATYFWGKTFVELPPNVIFPFLSSCIVYFMIGFQPTAEKFFVFVLVQVMMSQVGSSMGLALGAIVPNAEAASSLAPVTIIPFMLFAGLFQNVENIPVYFRPIEYISVFRYGLEAVAVNELSGLNITCPADASFCPFRSGEDALIEYGYTASNLWFDIGMTVVLFAAFRLMAWIALEAYAFRRRNSK
uniref:ABC transporter domain-containing protein n=1 Tax=Palpitomonas bilix TaxID=652834 RepID=A0A7S3CZZ8_9EUKA